MKRTRFPAGGLTGNTLVLLVAAFLVAFGNRAFFSGVLKTYPPSADNLAPLLSLAVVSAGTLVLLLGLLCWRRIARPVLAAVLLISAAAAHFMDGYGVVVNDEMLRSVAETDVAEARDLLSLKLLAYLALLGVLPAVLVAKVPLRWRGWRAEAFARAKLLAATLAVMVAAVLGFGSFYAGVAREHRELRTYANPAYPIYSAVKFARAALGSGSGKALVPIGTDARIPAWDKDRDLVILVVGETARADRFSLNGYRRETNPLLQKAGVVSFSDFWACGTSTAVSVPCMFALPGTGGDAATQENLLDVLQRAGVNVIWLDNNSDSKGVALRVPYRSFRTPETNPVCDEECRDEGMLASLQAYIDAHPTGDIFVVLHQMGNHGPAYFRRYPPAFEKFVPACRDNELSRCSSEEIGNAYDNAIVYTDYFLAQVIELLKKNSGPFETALFYVSDHGESLGEGGLYLHGMPKALAPDSQLHIPAVMWFGEGNDDVNLPALRAKQGMHFTHDNLFHTALGFLEVETSTYRRDMDILAGAREHGK